MKILAVGTPRSGTTWACRVLESCEHVAFYNEPDTPKTFPQATLAKERIGHLPIIAPGERDSVSKRDITMLQDIWLSVFIHDTGDVLAKTCASPFMVEWIVELCGVDKVLWINRKPMNTLSSWLEYARHRGEHLKHPIEYVCRKLAWQFGIQYAEYQRLSKWMPKSQFVVFNYEMFAQLTARHDFQMWHTLASQLGLTSGVNLETTALDLLQYGDPQKGNPGFAGYTEYDHIHRDETQIDDPNIWRQRMGEVEYLTFKTELQRWGIFA